MLKKINEAVCRFGLLNGTKHVTVALSGGADSMALLYALLELKDELRLQKISAAHFNHKIRGTEALRDQEFVTQQCSKCGIELFVGSADVPKFAKEQGLSLELAARQLRYEFLNTINTDVVATAHTASDNVETVLFNITRGTALSGLGGIPPKRDKYIRPLILCSREDVENYCSSKKIKFVTDSTNLCDDYTRNKIRHNVVSVLKSINPSIENSISRMSLSVCEDQDFINSTVAEKYNALNLNDGLLLNGFCDLHISIAKRIIVKYCSQCGIQVDNFHINKIYNVCLTGGKTSLPNNKYAIAKNGKLNICSNQCESVNFDVKIQPQKNDLLKNDKKVHNLLLKNLLDCDKIVGQLVQRTKQSGDTIRLKNKNCTKTLKKLFCEYKIPLCERQNLPVLCDEQGVVWIHKIGVAERVAVDSESNNIYKIEVKKL